MEKEVISKDIFELNHNESTKIFKQLCNGNFILNLERGEYVSDLSDKEMEKLLEEKKLNKELISVEKFLKQNGKILYFNFRDIEYWMTTREP